MAGTALCFAKWLPPTSAGAETPRLAIPRVERAPALDDFLNDRPREAEAVVEAFTQREPGDGVAASQETFAYLSYDAEHFYVVFVCRDREPDKVRARLAPREGIAADDQVGVLLDTFHDRRRAYMLSANPLGIQTDALLTEGQPDDFSYDAVWRSAGRLTTDGYVVWMAIPFKSLRMPPVDVQQWGIALLRHVPRNSEQSFWPAITKRVEGLAQQFATLDGLSAISRGRNVQLVPYGALAAASFRGEGGRFTRDTDVRPGLDAKLVLKDAITLDVTVNPDFSQVESDQPQVTTNQRFEVFFPEKRPFFIENAGLFLYGAIPATRNVPETLFFSRRIADPGLGARVTGKLGHWTLGGLAINDRAARRPGAPVGTEQNAHVGLLRIQREFGRQSSLGVLGSLRTLTGRVNRVGAIDTRFKLGGNWVLTALLAASRTTETNGSLLSGTAVNVNVNRTSRHILYSAFYSDRSPSFRTDLGFVPRTDIRQVEQYAEYRWRPTAGPVVAFGPNSYFRLNWDRQSNLQEWIVRYPFQVDLKGRTSVFVRRVETGELFRGRRFRQHFHTININTEWLKWLAVTGSAEAGTSVNFFPPPGVEPSLASFFTASLALSARAHPQLRADMTYLHSQLRDRPQSAGAPERPTLIFRQDIARLAVNYQFTRRLSVRAIADYRSVLPNVSRVALVRDKQLVADLLVTYFVQPGTALYVGYTGGFDDLGSSEDGQHSGFPTKVRARQLFVKASYQFRL